MEDTKRELAVLTNRVDTLAKQVSDDKARLNHNLERVALRLDTQNTLLQEACHRSDSRPSWGITFLITTLTGLVIGLATFLVTR